MPCDFKAALTASLIRKNQPSLLPADGSFGETKYVQGWAGSFLTAADYDPALSSATAFYEGSSGLGRSFVASLRSQGDIWLSESFDSGLGAYTLIQYLTGAVSIVDISDSDPAITGKALNLSTGGSLTAVAGIQKALGTIGDDFSMQYQVKLVAGSTVSQDAIHIMVQNNAGANLHTRMYRDNLDVMIDGAWVTFLVHYGDWAEYWWNAKKVSATQHEVTLYAGTQLVKVQTGVLPNDFTNNTIHISQQSGLDNFRQSQVTQVNVGPTQLPDDLIVTSPVLTPPHSPSTGHVYAILEDVSVNMLNSDGSLNCSNVKAFISKDNAATWAEVPMESQGKVANGEVDNTKPMILLTGSACFPAGTAAGLRLSLRTYNGGCYPVQAYEILWDYPT